MQSANNRVQKSPSFMLLPATMSSEHDRSTLFSVSPDCHDSYSSLKLAVWGKMMGIWRYEERKVKGPVIVDNNIVWEHITLLSAFPTVLFIALIYDQQRRLCSTLDHSNQKCLFVGCWRLIYATWHTSSCLSSLQLLHNETMRNIIHRTHTWPIFRSSAQVHYK